MMTPEQKAAFVNAQASEQVLVERVARAIADIDMQDRLGRIWTDDRWREGLERWRSMRGDENSDISDIDQPMRMAEAALAVVHQSMAWLPEQAVDADGYPLHGSQLPHCQGPT